MTILCLLANLIFSQVNFSLSPQLIELNIPAGVRKKIQFSLVNESKFVKLPLALYPADVIQTKGGTYTTVEIGKGTLSCAPWIELKDTLINLEPEAGKEITGYVKIPTGVKGGRYGAIVIETRLPEETHQIGMRMPVFLEITIRPQIKPKRVTITDIKFENPAKMPKFIDRKFNSALAVIASVKNEGDIHIKTSGNLIIV